MDIDKIVCNYEPNDQLSEMSKETPRESRESPAETIKEESIKDATIESAKEESTKDVTKEESIKDTIIELVKETSGESSTKKIEETQFESTKEITKQLSTSDPVIKKEPNPDSVHEWLSTLSSCQVEPPNEVFNDISICDINNEDNKDKNDCTDMVDIMTHIENINNIKNIENIENLEENDHITKINNGEYDKLEESKNSSPCNNFLESTTGVSSSGSRAASLKQKTPKKKDFIEQIDKKSNKKRKVSIPSERKTTLRKSTLIKSNLATPDTPELGTVNLKRVTSTANLKVELKRVRRNYVAPAKTLNGIKIDKGKNEETKERSATNMKYRSLQRSQNEEMKENELSEDVIKKKYELQNLLQKLDEKTFFACAAYEELNNEMKKTSDDYCLEIEPPKMFNKNAMYILMGLNQD
ncbi:11011_t:CDS:2 [Diversispora eburnea]|uniref:11011_t:CDS:1 n=1 Tax=Diversispora eburnea TaxID=1213867 RepID=A0A9N8WLT5_9GLOM|nr:11011_t:CDS:2 [Diversispora eburnea]